MMSEIEQLKSIIAQIKAERRPEAYILVRPVSHEDHKIVHNLAMKLGCTYSTALKYWRDNRQTNYDNMPHDVRALEQSVQEIDKNIQKLRFRWRWENAQQRRAIRKYYLSSNSQKPLPIINPIVISYKDDTNVQNVIAYLKTLPILK